ncbi:MAG TPA: SagB family peptide dehydrogenase [Bacillales bacterium]|nr:SagB family peptide dehydrogenase [Bacillales bacterium]
MIFNKYHESSSWPPVSHPYTPKTPGTNTRYAASDRNIFLPFQRLENEISRTVLNRKTSKTIIKGSRVNLDTLGTFLKWSAGVTEDGRRMYPSAGALYPNDIFVVIKQVDKVRSGLYRYVASEHALTWINEHNEIENAFVQTDIDCNFCLIIAADLQYAGKHYGERGYRFCLLEAGHIVQNMMLVAQAQELAIAPVGGFKDDEINVKMIPERFLAVYLVPVGRYDLK